MRNCNRCNRTLSLCGCKKTVVNRPTEVKVGGAGNDGLTAYQIAVLEGFVGTEQEWLESIKGEDGNDGLSPYIGSNGNWWVGDTDTGVPAEAEGDVYIPDTTDNFFDL